MNLNSTEDSKEVTEDQEAVIPLLRTHEMKNTENFENNTTSAGAIFVLINAALGAGLLAFPSAFWSSGGIGIGFLLQAVRM